MKILIVSAEVAPFAKVGGLADVAGALPKALAAQGHDVRVVMPLYRMIEDDQRWTLSPVIDAFQVQMNPGWTKTATLKGTMLDEVPFWFVGTDEWFTESRDSESIYQPGGMQHLFFSAAVLRMIDEVGWTPDVIHCNDWHTGFLPVLMREKDARRWDSTAAVFTIHNFAYQGKFGLEVLDALDLPHSLFIPDKVEAWGRVNFLKAGCAYADQVNTVSETYAKEIQTPEYGCRLDGLMRHLQGQGKLQGILNGIDTEVFDPATDSNIAAHYSATAPAGKAICKQELLRELGFPVVDAPLFGMVTRISGQKGLDLVLQIAEALFKLPVQLVVQGLGEPDLCEALKALEQKHPSNFCYVQKFDAALAQRIYSGCDGFLMPSAFEPCGLGQMIAMRYGTVPVVRKTGGLADTVFEGTNGFVFERHAPMDLLAAVVRAHDAYGTSVWESLRAEGMGEDFSWGQSARAYARLYQRAVADRSYVEAEIA